MAQTVTTPYAADWIPPQTLTGAELCRWMRRFRTTIRDLAQRLGMTQRRIRECRRAGLGNPHAVRDWLEAITGHDPGPRPEVAYVQRWELPLTCRCGRRLLLGDGVWRVYRHSWCSIDCFLIDRPELFRQSR